MGRSVGAPSHASAGFRHELSGTSFGVDGLVHEASRRGLTAKHTVALRVGSGRVGSSFAVTIGGRLFQSPVSWFAQRGHFDVSPGFELERHPDFDRPIRDECLLCHASRAGDTWTAIGCERCHGLGDAHRASPSRSNIVNPARLAGAIRDSVCDQCHLSGVSRIPHPGKTFEDFRAGETLESVWTTFVGGNDFKVVSHSEQWAKSKCRTKGGESLGCAVCHNPHPTAAKPVRGYDAVCRDCHQPHRPETACTGCHMAKRGAQDVHAAYTDHHVRREAAQPTVAPGSLRAWRPVPPEFLERATAFARGDLASLVKLAPAGDPEVLAMGGSILLQQGRAREALPLLQRAVEVRENDASAWFRLGLAEQALGIASFAARYEEAIRRDPFLFDAYAALAKARSGDRASYESVLRRFLRHAPQNLTVREALRK